MVELNIGIIQSIDVMMVCGGRKDQLIYTNVKSIEKRERELIASMRITTVELMNTIVKQNINTRKIVELSKEIRVNKDEIKEPPMAESTPSYLDRYSNTFDLVYAPQYDTAYIHSNEHTHLFKTPVGTTKSYAETNMVLSGCLPPPCMFVVRGFSMITSIHKSKLDKIMMRFFVLNKSYAKMPLSHLPFEYPDNRIIIPSLANFRVEVQSESTEEIKDELVFFINGWELRAVQ